MLAQTRRDDGGSNNSDKSVQSDGADGDTSEEDRLLRCKEKLSHPLHTYRINSLCLQCLRDREQRLARFEVDSIRDDVEREYFRQRNARKTDVKMPSPGLRSGYVEGKGRGMILDRTGSLRGIVETNVEAIA